MTFIGAIGFGLALLFLGMAEKKRFVGIVIVVFAKMIGAILLLFFMMGVILTLLNWLGLPPSPVEPMGVFLAWIAVLNWIARVLGNREMEASARARRLPPARPRQLSRKP